MLAQAVDSIEGRAAGSTRDLVEGSTLDPAAASTGVQAEGSTLGPAEGSTGDQAGGFTPAQAVASTPGLPMHLTVETGRRGRF